MTESSHLDAQREYEYQLLKFYDLIQKKIGNVSLSESDEDECNITFSCLIPIEMNEDVRVAINVIFGNSLRRNPQDMDVLFHHNYEYGTYEIKAANCVGYQSQDFDQAWEKFTNGLDLLKIILKI